MNTLQPLRSNDIREKNEKLVLHLIYTNAGISQSEISNLTGLKPPTVYRIFSLLEQRGHIRLKEGESVASERKGRRPSPYTVVPEALYAIGLDFWARSASVAVFNFAGEILHQKTSPLDENSTADSVSEQLSALIKEAIHKGAIDEKRVLGIGIGAPGIVDIEKGVVVSYDRIPGMNEFPLRDRISNRFGVPVEVHNACSAIALASYRYGPAHGNRSLAVFLIRTGLGGAYIHDGRLYVNQNKTAFEIGNFLVRRDEVPGQALEYSPGHAHGAGAAGDIRYARLEDSISEDGILEYASRAAGVRNWSELSRRLEEQDRKVIDSLAPIGELFATAACNVSHLLDPEAVLIVSRFHGLSRFFAESLSRRAAYDSPRVNLTRIDGVEYDAILACRGSADLVFDTFFAIQH